MSDLRDHSAGVTLEAMRNGWWVRKGKGLSVEVVTKDPADTPDRVTVRDTASARH